MMLANHVTSSLSIANVNSKFDSWIQNKRVLGDLKRMNMHYEVQFIYLSGMEVIVTSNPPSSQPQVFLTSSDAMEVGARTQQPPTPHPQLKLQNLNQRKPPQVSLNRYLLEQLLLHNQRGV